VSAARPTPFTLYNLDNVPDALRMLAHQIEAGQPEAIRCVVALEVVGAAGPEVTYRAFGADFGVLHAVGLCQVVGRMIEDAV
jgi:hypothetical protein